MLKDRVRTGALLVVIFLILLFSSHITWLLSGLLQVLAMIAVFELHRATRLSHRKAAYALCCVWITAVIWVPWAWQPWISGIVLLLAAIGFTCVSCRVTQAQRVAPWSVWLLSLLIPVCLRAAPWIRAQQQGLYLLFCAVAASVLTDVGAYGIGKLCGRHPLAPRISPHKTWEGAVGGVVSATVGVLLVTALFRPSGAVHYVGLLAYGAAASVIGQLSDLGFSAVKRTAGVKDYGRILPGHGGILDRFDGMLSVLPFTMLCIGYGGWL